MAGGHHDESPDAKQFYIPVCTLQRACTATVCGAQLQVSASSAGSAWRSIQSHTSNNSLSSAKSQMAGC
jgi:hypothetical protein